MDMDGETECYKLSVSDISALQHLHIVRTFWRYSLRNCVLLTGSIPEYLNKGDGGDVRKADEERHRLVKANPHESSVTDFEVVKGHEFIKKRIGPGNSIRGDRDRLFVFC